MKAWLRQIEVLLTSKTFKHQIQLSTDNDELEVEITGYKYLSALKDNFVVKIYNLTYVDMIQIIKNKYTDIEIKCGYKSLGTHTIFKGQVMYISNALEDVTTNVVYLICCSRLLGLYNNKLNLSLNSGINMYTALKFICKQAGINDSFVSEDFKNKTINECMKYSGSCSSIINQITNQSQSYVANSDSSYNQTLSISDLRKKASRVIPITEKNVILTNGYPKLTSDGLRITLLPSFNFMPGDVIEIDNALIDTSLQSKSEVEDTPNIGAYIDTTNNEKGQYVVWQVSYALQNRGSSFTVELNCKARKLYSNITGGE